MTFVRNVMGVKVLRSSRKPYRFIVNAHEEFSSEVHRAMRPTLSSGTPGLLPLLQLLFCRACSNSAALLRNSSACLSRSSPADSEEEHLLSLGILPLAGSLGWTQARVKQETRATDMKKIRDVMCLCCFFGTAEKEKQRRKS